MLKIFTYLDMLFWYLIGLVVGIIVSFWIIYGGKI